VTTTPPTNPAPTTGKPRISYFLATACGLGYLKPGPGTWGSLMGVGLSILITWRSAHKILSILQMEKRVNFWTNGWIPGGSALILVFVVAAIGVIVAGNVEKHAGKTDPQFVVIDEVSGQLIALSLPFIVLNWKSWLLGFILFRVFDIWKPFPARQAESLPGGWGIMADDWIAGILAGLVLWGVQALGVLR
jgi:phosphatidylglycerophosphatase A